MRQYARRAVMLTTCLLLATSYQPRITCAADSLPQTSEAIRSVATSARLQRAILDGVRHIVVSAHIAVNDLEADPEGLSTTKDNAIGDLKPTTRSIVGNCTEPPPAEWQDFMKNPLPPQACVIRTPEDFVEITKGVPELWIHNLYLMVDNEPFAPGSSTLILQHDGSLWITQSVFQGRSAGSRAIDMHTEAGGIPLLYAANTTFSDFNRDHGAAIRMLAPSLTTLVDVQFKRTTVVTPRAGSQWEGMAGSAVTAVNDSKLWLQDVVLEEQMVFDEADSSKAVAWTSAPPSGAVFSSPPLLTWDYCMQQLVQSTPLDADAGRRFLKAGSVLSSLQEEQAVFAASMYSSTATETPPEDPQGTDQVGEVSIDDIEAMGSSGKGSEKNTRTLIYILAGSALVVALVATAVAIALLRRRQRRRGCRNGTNATMATGGKDQGQLHEDASKLEAMALSLEERFSGLPPMHASRTSQQSNAATQGKDTAADSASSPASGAQMHLQSLLSSSPQLSSLPGSSLHAVHAYGLPNVTNGTTFDITSFAAISAPTSAGATLDRETLEIALDRLSCRRELFLGQFEMLGAVHRREGGQGTVQFANATRSGAAVAIKFFLNRNAFNVEEELYQREGLHGMMPAITVIENNDSGVAVTEEGWRFPPFIVVERGESLDEWQARIQPDFPTIVQVLSHVTRRVKTLHDLGLVHRDLKPGNVLWRPQQHSWTLIDFGCAASVGDSARLTYSLAYSAPETLQALHAASDSVIAESALDMWAVGVIAYELITGGAAFPTSEWLKWDIHAAALGKRAYPWEVEIGTFRNIPQLRALKDPIFACLSRSAQHRPTSEQFLAQLNGLFDFHGATTTTSTTTET